MWIGWSLVGGGGTCRVGVWDVGGGGGGVEVWFSFDGARGQSATDREHQLQHKT